jgi:hypothetical protein
MEGHDNTLAPTNSLQEHSLEKRYSLPVTGLKGEPGEKNLLAELDFIRFGGSAVIYPP